MPFSTLLNCLEDYRKNENIGKGSCHIYIILKLIILILILYYV